jgi:tRNA G18 (ribose-2'-O)-methylase SpoU
MTHPEIDRITKEQALLLKRYPFSVFLHDMRSLYNVGSIFRIADACLFEKVYLSGYTGTPPRKEIAKVALGAEESVAWEQVQDHISTLRKLKSQGVQLVALETGDDALDYREFQPEFPICLLLGQEVEGLSEEFMKLVDAKISLPMRGRKNSLNVSVAFGIAAYDLAYKWENIKKP